MARHHFDFSGEHLHCFDRYPDGHLYACLDARFGDKVPTLAPGDKVTLALAGGVEHTFEALPDLGPDDALRVKRDEQGAQIAVMLGEGSSQHEAVTSRALELV